MNDNPLDARWLRVLTWLAIGVCCAPALYLQYLPMQELPQYVALSRMLYRLPDFAPYYQLDLSRSVAILPLYLLGGLSELMTLMAATKIVVWLSVLSYPLGMLALLRAQHKPSVYALLGLPLVYAAPFYLGLLPSLASTGLALFAIALFHAPPGDRRARYKLGVVATMLPLTHPFGLCVVVAHVSGALLLERSSWRQRPWGALAPLGFGAAYWGVRALQTDGVAAFNYPGVLFRLFRLPESVLGGFLGRAEAYAFGGFVVLWVVLCRSHFPRNRAAWRARSDMERALWLTVALCLAGYLLLPSSTWSTTAIHVRAGVIGFSLLPALLPARSSGVPHERALGLLLALAAYITWQTSTQLVSFDKEARSFATIVEQVPERSKLLGLIYDNHGKLVRGSPYLHFAAYAQARHGGLLSLSMADYAWTSPLRKRADAPAVAPLFGSEWDPSMMNEHPEQFAFYNTVLTRGVEPREMTIMTVTGFQLIAHSSQWLLYIRPAGSDH